MLKDLFNAGIGIMIMLSFLCVVCLGITLLFVFAPKTIKSEKLLKPTIELTVKNNKIDTTYVYTE